MSNQALGFKEEPRCRMRTPLFLFNSDRSLLLMLRIATSTMALAYEHKGGEEGVPLVLLHGFTGHRDDFVHVTSALAQERPVLVPDLRGHGDSARAERPEDYTFASCIGDLLAFLDALSIERCDLLGHSMGGMVALRFALEHPARLRSMILMSTSASALPPKANEALRKGQGFLEERDLITMQKAMEAVGRAEPDPVLAPWADHYWAHQRRRYAAMDPNAYLGFATAMVEQESVAPRLHEIGMPTSILIGTTDRDFLEGAQEMAAGIQGVRLNNLEGAGHHPHEEEPEQFFRALERHFEGLSD